jgi:hypothetical protein
MTNEHPQKKAFMAAIAAAEKEFPDQPVLLIAASVLEKSGEYDFPCAIGGRNLDGLGLASDGLALIAAVVRSVLELCRELNGHDKRKGDAMFKAALEDAVDLQIDTLEHESGKSADSMGPDLERGFLKHIKDSLG